MALKYSREELLEGIRELADELGRVPTRKDMAENGDASGSIYSKRFDSWNEALRLAGFEPNHRVNVSMNEVLDEVHRLKDELGRVPTSKDMDREGEFSSRIYRSRFGTWNKALREVGYEPLKRRNIPRDELINELIRVGEEIQSIPSASDMTDRGKFGENTYLREFGSWVNALEAAGFDYEYYHWAQGENHPNWKGGHDRYYGKSWWSQREKCLERDDFECQSCGVDDEILHVHHITPFRIFENYESANQLSNLVTLCGSCHKRLEGSHILDTAEEFKQKV